MVKGLDIQDRTVFGPLPGGDIFSLGVLFGDAVSRKAGFANGFLLGHAFIRRHQRRPAERSDTLEPVQERLGEGMKFTPLHRFGAGIERLEDIDDAQSVVGRLLNFLDALLGVVLEMDRNILVFLFAQHQEQE